MQEHKQHFIWLGVKPGLKKDRFHPYKKIKNGRGGHQCQTPQGIFYQPVPSSQYRRWNIPSSPTLNRVVAEEAEMVAGDAAMEIAQKGASSSIHFNDVSQTMLLSTNLGQGLITSSDDHLDYPYRYPPTEGEKTLECLILPKKRILCTQATPCIQSLQEEETTPCVHPHGVVIQDQASNTIKPASGRQAEVLSIGMANPKHTHTQPQSGRVQSTLQGASSLVQETLHNQQLCRLQQSALSTSIPDLLWKGAIKVIQN